MSADDDTPTGGAEAVSYVRLGRIPRMTERGLTVVVSVVPLGRRESSRGPTAAIAHAQDGAGWAVGLSGEGRATVSVGTLRGPVSLSTGESLREGERTRIVARIPGAPGQFLRIEANGASSAVVLGAPVVPAPGELLLGCRELRDARTPLQSFVGRIEDAVVVADADADGSVATLLAHPALLAGRDRPLTSADPDTAAGRP